MVAKLAVILYIVCLRPYLYMHIDRLSVEINYTMFGGILARWSLIYFPELTCTQIDHEMNYLFLCSCMIRFVQEDSLSVGHYVSGWYWCFAGPVAYCYHRTLPFHLVQIAVDCNFQCEEKTFLYFKRWIYLLVFWVSKFVTVIASVMASF